MPFAYGYDAPMLDDEGVEALIEAFSCYGGLNLKNFRTLDLRNNDKFESDAIARLYKLLSKGNIITANSGDSKMNASSSL